jgi:hypothetical protein
LLNKGIATTNVAQSFQTSYATFVLLLTRAAFGSFHTEAQKKMSAL